MGHLPQFDLNFSHPRGWIPPPPDSTILLASPWMPSGTFNQRLCGVCLAGSPTLALNHANPTNAGNYSALPAALIFRGALPRGGARRPRSNPGSDIMGIPPALVRPEMNF